jgi:hypothetical protein
VRLCALLVALCACASESAEPAELTRKDCERLRDHLIELRMESVTADQEQHRMALRAAMDGFVPRCQNETSTDQLQCGLLAKDSHALAGCGAL